ncbi:hypothetical protein [Nocardia sp. NPDC127526]|uniref:hypothetical protein n=1 Tax=Nocardia sp. NPDC127526 TaxID=3345393 RepID=UPI00363AD7CF
MPPDSGPVRRRRTDYRTAFDDRKLDRAENSGTTTADGLARDPDAAADLPTRHHTPDGRSG